jgi:tight adherence protein C
MLDLIYTKLTDPHFLLSVLVALATMATIVTIAMPPIESDTLRQRMKAVATERERIRARERERLMADKGKRGLRQEPKAYMKQIVERFNLSKWLGTAQAKSQMAMAGFRGPQAEVAFLFFRLRPRPKPCAFCRLHFCCDQFPAGWTIESRYCPLRHVCRLKGAGDLS